MHDIMNGEELCVISEIFFIVQKCTKFSIVRLLTRYFYFCLSDLINDYENFQRYGPLQSEKSFVKIVSRIYSVASPSEPTRANDDLLTSILNYQKQTEIDKENEMPIVKSSNGDTPQQENGVDKSMFSVSRVKKVELSEIPRASDICSTRKF